MIHPARPHASSARPGPSSRCVVLVPVSRYIEPPCEQGLRALEQAGYPVRRIHGHSDIARGRSVIATEALADGFEELMWIDSDITFTVADVEKLRSHRRPIVGGIYPLKGKRRLAMTITGQEQRITFGRGGGLIELMYIATGFLLTHHSVYSKIREHHDLPICRGEKPCGVVPYFLSVITDQGGQKNYLGEDFSFCWRAREAGLQIFADTTIRLGHVGTYTYSWEDAGGALPRGPSYKITVKGALHPRPAAGKTVDGRSEEGASVADQEDAIRSDEVRVADRGKGG